MQRREDGGGGQRQAATCKVDALGMASCMPICYTLLLASCKSWETLKQQPLVGHLSLDSLPYFTFFFCLFASTHDSTLNSQGSRPLLLLPPASADPASSKPPPWLLDAESTILQAFLCLLLHLIMIQSSSSFIFVDLKIVF